jgi:hypothetical protein
MSSLIFFHAGHAFAVTSQPKPLKLEPDDTCVEALNGDAFRAKMSDVSIKIPDLRVTMKLGEGVSSDMAKEVEFEYRQLLEFTGGLLRPPKDMVIILLAINLPEDFISGQPGYDRTNKIARLTYRLTTRHPQQDGGQIIPPQIAKAERLHEIMHALMWESNQDHPTYREIKKYYEERDAHSRHSSELYEQLRNMQSAVPKDEKLIEQIKARIEQSTIGWARAKNKSESSPVALLHEVFEELLADIEPTMQTGLLDAISIGDGSKGRSFTRLVGPEDLPAVPPALSQTLKIERQPNGHIGFEFSPPSWWNIYGMEQKSYFDPVRSFIGREIMLKFADMPNTHARIYRVIMKELDLRFSNASLGFHEISPRIANERLIQQLTHEFVL